MSRQNEIDLHEAMQDHFSALGKGFRAASSNSSETADTLDEGHELLHCLKTDAGISNAMGAACEKIAGWHASKARAAKIADADELTKMNGSAIGIPMSDVPPEGFGIRAVRRAGQPKAGDIIDKASVPIEFRHLLDE
jgi:hypothetical protein